MLIWIDSFFLELESAQEKQKYALVRQSMHILGVYLVSRSADFRCFQSTLGPGSPRDLLVLQQLLDSLCVLMYSLDWGVFCWGE